MSRASASTYWGNASSPPRLNAMVGYGRKVLRCFLPAAIALLAGCRPAPHAQPAPDASQPSPWFEDVTAKSGLNFIHGVGPVGSYFMPENVGSGLAFIDFDNDGRLDVYLIQNAGADSASRNQLFRQQADGSFRDVSAGSGLDVAGRGMGVAIGDVNNDGADDVLVTEYGGVRLFLNQGDGSFRETTSESGLDNPFWAISAAFLDYDRDGWLDLVVGNYVAYDPRRPCFDERGQREYCGPKTFPGTVTKLFRNRGAGALAGTFEDVTTPAGLGSLPGPALGVVCADFDGDHWADIFVANDGDANRLWMNKGNGTFKDQAATRGVAYASMGQPQGNMGIGLADVDGDNAFDLFVTHLIEETHALWTQGPRGLFQDRTAMSGLAAPHWHGTGFGTVLQDFDNDGAPDVAIANGGVRRNKLVKPDARTIAAVGSFWAPYAERNQLFANDGTGRFRDLSGGNESFCGTARIGRGLICGDLNNDGGLDLIVSNVASAARVYRNVAPQRGRWLLVRAIDPELGGRDVYGAVITVVAGAQRISQWSNPGSSYASSNDPRAHFGLGKAAAIDAIEVLWPDGQTESFAGGAADRLIVLRKGSGKMKTP